MALLWMLNLSDGSSSILSILLSARDYLERLSPAWIAVFWKNSRHSFGDAGAVRTKGSA
jgi:hypothetical protein